MQKTFLQSEEWEAFQQMAGRRTWRVQGILVVRHDIPGGFNYLYSPHPACFDQSETESFLGLLQNLAKEQKSVFLKIDPADSFGVHGPSFKISRSLQPSKTILLDLTLSEAELLSCMHPKTRYNIRLAEKKGVTITSDTLEMTRLAASPTELVWRASDGRANNRGEEEKKFEVFWKLLQETAGRNGFHAHEKSYYRKLLEVRSPCFSNEFFFAEYGGAAIAGAMVNFFSSANGVNRVTYLHGASLRNHREAMAPHLLHWHIMREAKRRGFETYDLWGIDETRWPGVTRFKKGFGGRMVVYPASVDIIYRPWMYEIYIRARKYA